MKAKWQTSINTTGGWEGESPTRGSFVPYWHELMESYLIFCILDVHSCVCNAPTDDGVALMTP